MLDAVTLGEPAAYLGSPSQVHLLRADRAHQRREWIVSQERPNARKLRVGRRYDRIDVDQLLQRRGGLDKGARERAGDLLVVPCGQLDLESRMLDRPDRPNASGNGSTLDANDAQPT
jgi:hypothetical protein